MPFQRRGSCIFHWRRRAWLTKWDNVKSHGTVRLRHRKRVTCELHDSYFCSMTIKHAIPRTVEVTHPDGKLWGDIEWAIELLYNSVKTGSQLVWRPDPLVTRCGRESQHPTQRAPRPPVEQSRRTRTRHGYVWRGWGDQYIAVFVQSLTPSHTQTLQIKWEVYFSIRTVSLSLLCRRYDSACTRRCIVAYGYTTLSSIAI